MTFMQVGGAEVCLPVSLDVTVCRPSRAHHVPTAKGALPDWRPG
jgi:hypothetical protein